MNENHPTCTALNQHWTVLEAYFSASQKAVSAQFTSKQILPFAFAEHREAVSAHFTSKQILPFAFEEHSDPENPGKIRKSMLDDFGLHIIIQCVSMSCSTH